MNSNDGIAQSIIMALCYADVFDYPLTKSELHKYSIGKQTIPKDLFEQKLNQLLNKFINEKDNLFFLTGRGSTISQRKRRYFESEKKLIKAKKISKLLSKIPTILLIGVSGSVAAQNASKRDDIDLFFITYQNTIWITRLFVVLFLLILGEKRSRHDVYGTDKICPNIFLSFHKLEIDKKNLFTAHEIVQLKVIINKKNTYKQFLYKNRWIKNYLPHARSTKNLSKKNYEHINSSTAHAFFSNVFAILLDKFDHILYQLQHYYMLSHKHNEIVKKDFAFFHPRDKTSGILSSFRKKYHQIMLENISKTKELYKPSSGSNSFKDLSNSH